MKKLFLVLAISAAFVACNNNADTTTTTTDSTMMDKQATVAPVVTDSMNMMPIDSTNMMDTTHKM